MNELRLDVLSKGDRVVVRTRSSEYRIDVIDPVTRVVSISGGSLPAPRRVHLIGRLAPKSFEEASIVLGRPIAYTYLLQARLFRTETSDVTGIEHHAGPQCATC